MRRNRVITCSASTRDTRLTLRQGCHRGSSDLDTFSRQAFNPDSRTALTRDDGLLPPAISLDKLADGCSDPVSEAAVESELTTFLNQVEGHVGKPAVLKVAPGFEDRYHIAERVERNLWLERDWFQPDYAGRPWTLWTANSSLHTEAGPEPVRWVVLQP